MNCNSLGDELVVILHIIPSEKFTVGYINFMKTSLNTFKHVFLVQMIDNSKFDKLKLINNDNIYYFSETFSLNKEPIYNLIDKADKIIVSGVFGVKNAMFYWKKDILKKSFLHFWGGDFYYLKQKKNRTFNDYLDFFMTKSVFRRVGNLVFLLDEEYEYFQKITHVKGKRVLSAPMPLDDEYRHRIESFAVRKNSDKLRIIVGNSATRTCCHIEAFRELQKLLDKDVEVVCPLSYGDMDYGKIVIENGKKMLGNKFIPITDWMNGEDYLDLLYSCDIGIFYNDRQQALGNIFSMLFWGKIVVLKQDTSMYKYFLKNGCKIWDFSDFKKKTFPYKLESGEKINNRAFIGKILSKEYQREKWNNILSER